MATEIPVKQFCTDKKLGEGSYGDIYTGMSISDDSSSTPVAVKMFKKDIAFDLISEMSVWKNLPPHPYVSKAEDVVIGGDNVFALIPLMSGDMASMKMNVRNYKVYLFQLCLAVKHMHDHGFVHSDLKMANILYREDEDCIKLSDFGLTFRWLPGEPAVDSYSSLGMPKDDFGNTGNTHYIDIFNLGVLFITVSYIVHLRAPPPKYMYREDDAVFKKTLYRFVKNIPDKELSKLVYQITNFDEPLDKRITDMSDIIAHPFFNDVRDREMGVCSQRSISQPVNCKQRYKGNAVGMEYDEDVNRDPDELDESFDSLTNDEKALFYRNNLVGIDYHGMTPELLEIRPKLKLKYLDSMWLFDRIATRTGVNNLSAANSLMKSCNEYIGFLRGKKLIYKQSPSDIIFSSGGVIMPQERYTLKYYSDLRGIPLKIRTVLIDTKNWWKPYTRYFKCIMDEIDELTFRVSAIAWNLSDQNLTTKHLIGHEWPDGLQKLNLSNNQLTTLDGVEFPDGLLKLYLSGNNIILDGATFPDSLQELYLGDNQLTTLDGVAFPDGLLKLNLSYNNLTLDGVEFPDGLQELNLFSNQLTTLYGVAFPDGLLKLNLSNNNLTLDGVAFPDGLQELNLTANKLTTLDGVAFPDGLRKLNLSRNPIISANGIRIPEGVNIKASKGVLAIIEAGKSS